ncbi:MAG: ATP synthase F1 subunit delta [Bryobacterales bacterium]|nr:ATP synthase F1 subunit delta [Bryobacterales bacterium]
MSLAVATRYANALVDVVMSSRGSMQPAAIAANLRDLEAAVESSSELRNALITPAITPARKKAVMGRICDILDVHPLVRNFVFIIVRNRRADLFPRIRRAFERLLDERTGMVRAEISSASELNPALRPDLEAQLSRLTGKQVKCSYTIDPTLLGGVVARIGSTVYDGSVRGQLETLRRELSTGA